MQQKKMQTIVQQSNYKNEENMCAVQLPELLLASRFPARMTKTEIKLLTAFMRCVRHIG